MDDHAGDPPGGGEHVLARLPRLTATQARRIAIAHADAYSDERRAARARARAIAREQGRLDALDRLMQQARGGADHVLAARAGVRDTLPQVAADAAMAAFLGGSLDDDDRQLLMRPWARALRIR